jgi:hypothetical protein
MDKMKKFKVKFLETSGQKGHSDYYVKEKEIFLTLGDKARKEDVLNELIKQGYRGEILNIQEVGK